MGFHAGVLQVWRCEQDLNVLEFALLSFSQSRQCNQHHKNNLLCKNLWICGCFVFVVKEAFDLPCLPQDYKDEIEIIEFVKFCNKIFTEFFVSAPKQNKFTNFNLSSSLKILKLWRTIK